MLKNVYMKNGYEKLSMIVKRICPARGVGGLPHLEDT